MDGPMGHIRSLPDSPNKIKTRFIAYSRPNWKTGLEINPMIIKSVSVIVPNKPLVVIIHGFAGNANKTELLGLKDSLFEIIDIWNVIIVDWSSGAQLPRYAEAATNTQVVGRQIAFLVNVLKTQRQINPFAVHLIGFSLGSHIAGFAGKFSQMQYNWKFGRISALDAAGPLFEGFPGSHLTKEDAYFVDVIHTSAGNNILKGELGFVGPIGRLDFYPNNGSHQPRCQRQSVLTICDHNSALHYMESSLRAHHKCSFTAFKCNSWSEFVSGVCTNRRGRAVMGYLSVISRSVGKHYLKTSAKYPYCLRNGNTNKNKLKRKLRINK